MCEVDGQVLLRHMIPNAVDQKERRNLDQLVGQPFAGSAVAGLDDIAALGDEIERRRLTIEETCRTKGLRVVP